MNRLFQRDLQLSSVSLHYQFFISYRDNFDIAMILITHLLVPRENKSRTARVNGNVCIVNIIQNDRTLNLNEEKEKQKRKGRSKPRYEGHRKCRRSYDSSRRYNFSSLLLPRYYCYHVCRGLIRIYVRKSQAICSHKNLQF